MTATTVLVGAPPAITEPTAPPVGSIGACVPVKVTQCTVLGPPGANLCTRGSTKKEELLF